jgi:hypothetical protein
MDPIEFGAANAIMPDVTASEGVKERGGVKYGWKPKSRFVMIHFCYRHDERGFTLLKVHTHARRYLVVGHPHQGTSHNLPKLRIARG